MKHCSNCGQDFEGNFCPNCGKVADGSLKCPKCGTEITGNFCPNCGYSVRGVKPAAAETQRKSIDLSKITGSAAFVFVKKHWALLLVAVLLLVAFLTLMITLVGLRGIYVNVNNPDDYYDFDATSYRASTIDFLTGKDALEEGTWKLSGNTLTLTINDEDFGKLSDDFDFEKVDGFKRVKIDDVEYKRVSLVGLKTTKQKLKIKFDAQGVNGVETKKIKIGAKLPTLEDWKIKDPTNGYYGFLGWYTEPDGKGEMYYENERVWEDRTYYAYWCQKHASESYEHDDDFHWQICDICGKQFGKRNHTVEWIVTKQPICVLEGTEAYQCICGYKDDRFNTRSVAATGHTFGDWIIDAENYSCEDIVTRHKDCANCDYQQIDENYVVPHELGDWIIDGENVCNKDNTPVPRHKECANCDYQLIDNNYVVPHQMGEWIEDNPASCTKKAHHHKECANCDHREDEDYGNLLPHEMSDWIIDGEYTCGDTVTAHKDCANCEYMIVNENYIVPHAWKEQLTADKQKECEKCGYKENVYEERDGKIYFGEYPQTKETDNGIIATLAQMSGNKPAKGNAGTWTDYGYYIGGRTTEYMWYIDLEYGGARYRGVYFTSYRPYWTIYSSSTGNSNQDDNGYYINTLYWFKWEPIEWRVLEKENGEAFLMSNVILDSQQFDKSSNNYANSDIRAWLNGTFYNWAFDELDQSIIKTTLVDNSAATTSNSSNSYACEDTNDKVFLLSYKDVINTSYGFNPGSSNYDTARRLKTTDYAQSQGAYTETGSSYRGNGWWWLRSPYYSGSSNSALYVNYTGYADDYYYVDYTNCGVVPALRITL